MRSIHAIPSIFDILSVGFLLIEYGSIHANLANFRVLLKLLGDYVALDKGDVSHKTSA